MDGGLFVVTGAVVGLVVVVLAGTFPATTLSKCKLTAALRSPFARVNVFWR